jgi:hypothetical protein
VSGFGHPAFLAGTSALLALVVHPAARAGSWLPAAPVATAILVLFVLLSLLVRARSGRGEALLAAGALVLVAALAWDGVRGQRGTVRLGPGEATSNFAEESLGGRPLGLRPLGAPLSFESPLPGGGMRIVLPAGSFDLSGDEVVELGAFRLGPARLVGSGEVRRLVVAVTGGGRTDEAEVRPDAPGRVGDLVISLERYFPDFAIDDKQQPFTRSREARNPAALLVVERDGKRYRVFVLQAMPGLHEVQELGRSFALRSVEPEETGEIAVHREPAAPLALLGALVLAAGAGLLAFPTRPA